MNKPLIFLFALVFIFSCTPRAIPVIPTVTSGEVTNITTTTATCTGNLTADGGATILARGVCWSTSQFPTISDSKISSGTGLGVFTDNITGLSPNTNYYVRAYATNSVGTAYGDQKTFKTQEEQKIPSVTTGDVTNITTTTADCSGNVTSDGNAAITARGVCWSTSENPTISNSKTTEGTSLGTYTSNITGLSPNTTYYVKAYATNSIGTAYGEQKSFKTQDDRTIPSVTTEDVTNITTRTATCTGNVTADGKADITARGICWSTSENPTTSNSKIINGLGLGTYTSNITGLSPNTTYYVKAYATNSIGTAYGEQKSFKTQDESFIDRRDGKVYKYVTIGNQVWMAENLAYLPSVVGPRTSSIEYGHASDKYYYVYGYYRTSVTEAKAYTNYTTYGVLYNLPAALFACPSGWHLPTDAEWKTLIDYLGGEEVAGGKMKETGTAHWDSPNKGATNESGFTALAGGLSGLEFYYIGNIGYWWSSTLSDQGESWSRYIDKDASNVKRRSTSNYEGISVRCVKN
ncbi:MAG: FISUMP domain-containing protein [Bacteroidales bacterium]|nr:FISUMP domain-containing protein [Bacteroidales bacterium]